MTRDEIIECLRNIVKEASTEKCDWQSLGADTTIESLGFDSLSVLDLLYGVEQETGVALDPAEVMKIRTIGGIADLLAARMEAS